MEKAGFNTHWGLTYYLSLRKYQLKNIFHIFSFTGGGGGGGGAVAQWYTARLVSGRSRVRASVGARVIV